MSAIGRPRGRPSTLLSVPARCRTTPPFRMRLTWINADRIAPSENLSWRPSQCSRYGADSLLAMPQETQPCLYRLKPIAA